MSEGIKWGEDPVRDCAELKRLENYGIYPSGHHDQMCSVCNSEAPPVSNFVVVPEEPAEVVEVLPEPPREENKD